MKIKSKKCKYAMVRDQIIACILERNLPDGSQLPPEAELIDMLNVARNTVRTALELLVAEGIVVKRSGHPCVINRKAIAEAPAPRQIAWIDVESSVSSNPVYFEIFRAVTEESVRRNIRVNYVSLLSEEMMQSYLLVEHNYSGTIFNAPKSFLTSGFLEKLKTKQLVLLDPSDFKLPYRMVGTDNYAGASKAINYLIEQGHRKIVFMGIAPTFSSYAPFGERLRGYRDTMDAAGLKRLELFSESVDVYCNIKPFLAAHHNIINGADAIFAISDMLALTLLTIVPQLGFRIPEDISLIGFDGIMHSEFVVPSLTTVRQPFEEIARMTLEIILDSDGNSSGTESNPCQIEPDLRLGGTVIKRK
ncbi:MAG: GntR family transcriptional regulator [Lentisphaerota bacterium]